MNANTRRPDSGVLPAGSPSRPLQVLFLLHSLEPGGATVYVLRLAEELRRRGSEASVLSLRASGKEEALLAGLSIPHRCLGLRSAYDRHALPALVSYLRSARPSVLHTNHPVDALWGNLAARRTGVPCVTTFHGTLDQFSLQKSRPLSRALTTQRYLWVERIAGRCAHRSIAISRFVARELTGRRICPPSRVAVIHHGIDTRRFAPQPAARGADGRLVVGCIARISPEKGIHVLLRAIPAVRARFPQVEFQLIGEAKTEPEQHYLQGSLERLEAAGARAGLRLLGQQPDTVPWMAGMDVVAVPSLSEGFGLVVVEAMAMGKPIIAARAGGIPEIVAEGETGLLAPAGDEAALGQGIASLLANPLLREKMGQAGRRRVEHAFSQSRMVEETLALYGEAVGCGAGEPGRHQG